MNCCRPYLPQVYLSKFLYRQKVPTVSGYAYPQDSPYFLRFYFNEKTGTIAFALIENQQRIWGIDYDNRRGWHLHPVEQPTRHIPINVLSISKIVAQLQQVLQARG